jgi:hypothetical protein
MKTRTYRDVQGNTRTLQYVGPTGRTVNWKKDEEPSLQEQWLDETGYLLHIPVAIWDTTEYEDTED